jgi:hypothetical protein
VQTRRQSTQKVLKASVLFDFIYHQPTPGNFFLPAFSLSFTPTLCYMSVRPCENNQIDFFKNDAQTNHPKNVIPMQKLCPLFDFFFGTTQGGFLPFLKLLFYGKQINYDFMCGHIFHDPNGNGIGHKFRLYRWGLRKQGDFWFGDLRASRSLGLVLIFLSLIFPFSTT